MTTVRDIYNALFAFAPASMKMDWDNVGLLCGRFDAPVDTVLVALDPMPDVIDEAKKTGAQCIVTHHPLFLTRPEPSTMQATRGGAFWNWPKRRSPRSICTRILTSAPAGSTTYWQKHWG